MNERYYFKLKYADDNTDTDEYLNMYEPVNIKYTYSIVEDGNVGFGNFPSANISFDIYDSGPAIDGHLMSVWYGTDDTEAENYKCLGIFKMQATLWSADKQSYTGYDAAVYALNDTYVSELEYPITVKSVLSEIEKQTGIGFVTSTLPVAVIKSKPEGMKYRQTIEYIAGLLGRNAFLKSQNQSGQLKAIISFDWFDYLNTTVITDDMIYEDDGFELENKDGYKVGCVKCYTSGDELLTSGDTTAHGITINNPYMYQSRLDDILTYITDKNLIFYPVKVRFIGNMSFTPNDVAQVTTGGVTYKLPIASVTQECDGGLITTIECFAQDEDYEDAGTVPSSGGGNGSGGGTSTETAKYLNPPNSASYRTGEKGELIHKRADTSDYFAVKSYSGKEILKIYYETGALESNGQKLDFTLITAEDIEKWYGETVIPDMEGLEMISEVEAPDYNLTSLDFEMQIQTCVKVE